MTISSQNIIRRPSQERGHADHGWLNSYHTFSFASYYDPRHKGFRTLRVINEDRVAGGMGFDEHPHNDMEIISIALEGSLEHKDSLGTSTVIKPGEVQRMSAGTGVIHSEFNHSKTETVHFYQIWIFPHKKGLAPSYAQKFFPPEDKQNRLRLLLSPTGEQGSLTLNQDARIFDSNLQAQQSLSYQIGKGRGVWVQMTHGQLDINGVLLQEGDGAAIENLQDIQLTAIKDAVFLLFDLA